MHILLLIQTCLLCMILIYFSALELLPVSRITNGILYVLCTICLTGNIFVYDLHNKKPNRKYIKQMITKYRNEQIEMMPSIASFEQIGFDETVLEILSSELRKYSAQNDCERIVKFIGKFRTYNRKYFKKIVRHLLRVHSEFASQELQNMPAERITLLSSFL